MERVGSTRFGELLRRHRLAAVLSQEALAERAGLSVDAIRALERGRRGVPRPDTVVRLVEALGLDPEASATLIGAGQAPPSSRKAGVSTLDEEPPFRQTLPTGSFLGSLPTGLLVARDAEMAMVRTAIEDVVAGNGRTLLLGGEAGVGKTRLAQEATQEAIQRGFLTAAGHCYETEQSVPYYPFLEIFAGVYQATPTALQQEAAARWPYLAALLPNHLGLPNPGGGSEDQQRVLFAASAFLELVAQYVPLAVLLDDLHWADFASARLLRHLARQTRSAPVLILGTYRPDEVDATHPLADALREMSREDLVTRVTVGRLDEGGTAGLLAGILSEGAVAEELVQLVQERTEGNPFFAQHVVRELVERGDVFWHDGQWRSRWNAQVEVPETVRLVIGRRVRRLGEPADDILREASVLGQTFDFEDLAGMSDHTRRELEVGLDAAEQFGLINETGRDNYRFDHSLTRETLYGELTTRRRRRLHQAAAVSIERLPERKRERRAAELVGHFLEGEEPGRAFPYAVLAGDQAEAVFAHREAEHHYRTALQLARETDDGYVIAQTYEKLALPLHRSCLYDQALEALEQAAAFYESRCDFDNLLPVMAEIAGVHSNCGTPQEGMTRLTPLLPHFEAAPPSPGLILLYASLSSLLFVLGCHAEQLAIAERSTRLAETLDDGGILAVAKEQLGLALLSVRRRDEGRRALAEAMALAEAAGDLRTFGLALNNAAYAAEVQGELEESRRLFERGLELARRRGEPAQVAFMAYALGRNHLELGDWLRARAYEEEAVEVSRETGASWVAPYPLLGLGRVLLAQGDATAEDALHEGLDIARSNDDTQALDIAQCSLAELDLARGHPDLARERLQQAGVSEAWDPDAHDVSLSTVLVLARACSQLEARAEAMRLVELVIEQARRAGERLVLAEALPVRALLEAQNGNHETAERDSDEALALARRVRYPYAEARALSQLVTIRTLQGELETAGASLDEALTIFRRLGAKWDIERTERELAALASYPRVGDAFNTPCG